MYPIVERAIKYILQMALTIPTTIRPERVQVLKRLYKKHFNLELTDEETLERGVKMLQFITIVIDNNDAFKD